MTHRILTLSLLLSCGPDLGGGETTTWGSSGAPEGTSSASGCGAQTCVINNDVCVCDGIPQPDPSTSGPCGPCSTEMAECVCEAPGAVPDGWCL